MSTNHDMHDEPAFPVPKQLTPGWQGMSLRDWFAGQAVPAAYENLESGAPWSKLAETAYKVADAMLAERAKERP